MPIASIILLISVLHMQTVCSHYRKILISIIGNKAVKDTNMYLAPEVLLGKAETTSTDLYSLGVTVTSLLSKAEPISFEFRKVCYFARFAI